MKAYEHISIRDLKIFIQVCESGNLSTVARDEQVSPSLVSRTIYQMEEALGQQLFYRSTRSVAATEAGLMLLDYAREITGQWHHAQQRLQERGREPSGLVRINAPVIFAQRHIVPYLPELLKRHPDLHIELSQSDDFINPLGGTADLIFRISGLADSSLKARIFGKERYLLACSPDYLTRHSPPQCPQDLIHHQGLLYKGANGIQYWLAQVDGEWQKLPAQAKLFSNNAEALITWALNGMGILLMPEWSIGEYIQSGQLVKLLPDHAFSIKAEQLYIHAIYPNSRHVPLNVRAVLDFFIEIYGEVPYWEQNKAV
ncbi:MAG: LysR substrate-binding domain-containing protein [Neisseria sp.]|nr:LysR substrate-binding domain-containing protein [Neisseria sp.]